MQWNAEKFPSGLYFYQLKAGNFSETKKMILMK
ncbi:MAG: T9SS type A sorting domain-containing protein [Ignavibacteriales bacterium]|nr:T9SS type A sorting domain-containing protein [Ignavibacteriales bacterium]